MTRQLMITRFSLLAASIGLLSFGSIVFGQGFDLSWTAGGAANNFDDTSNWVIEDPNNPGTFFPAAPAFPFPDYSLKFDPNAPGLAPGDNGVTITNDLDPNDNFGTALQLGPGTGTEATSAAFHFLPGSGNYTISGFPVTAGSSGNDGVFRADAGAGLLQTFDIPITFTGGQKRRKVVLGNNGTVVFNGSINYTNSLMFIDEAAGTVELNGDNTGVGSGFGTYGTNAFRQAIRNNVANTVLKLGSDTALGDKNTGTWDAGDLFMTGITANGIVTIVTDPNVDLSGYHFSVSNASGGGGIRFDQAHDSKIGYLVRNGSLTQTRTFSNYGAGTVTIEEGVFLSFNDQASSNGLGIFSPGSGGIVINGRLHTSAIDPISAANWETDPNVFVDNSSRGGISEGFQLTPLEGGDPNDAGFQYVNATMSLRDGNITLNADSSGTWISGQIGLTNSAVVTMGHDNAFGDSNSLLSIGGNSTIDLNGHDLPQRFNKTNNGLGGTGVGGQGAIINSDPNNASEVLQEIVDVANFSVGGAGDITLNNVRRTNGVQRAITKVGAGTLTLSGELNNSRYGLTVNEGEVLLSKSDPNGVAANATARYTVSINNGTKVTIANSAEDTVGAGINDQIDDIMLVDVNDGTLDLGGNQEGIGNLSGDSTGIVESVFGAGPFHGNTEAGLIIGASTSAAVQTTGRASYGTWVWDGTIRDGGAHPVGVVVTGGVREIFNGTNTYTGETVVSDAVVSGVDLASTLEVNGSITSTSKVTVDPNSILSGTGTIVSPEWDIHGTVVAGAAPDPDPNSGAILATASDVLTVDYSASTGSTFMLFNTSSTASFVLDSGMTSSTIDVVGSISSLIVFDNNTFEFTDLTDGSLTAGTYTLFDGDANTLYSLGGSVSLSGLDDYAGSTVSVSGNDLVLNLAPFSGLPGDFNGDGRVDGLDFLEWQRNPGIGSLSDWEANYGLPITSTTTTVPEPSCVLLLVSGLVACGVRRRPVS